MQIDGGTLLVCVHVEEKGREDSQRVHTPCGPLQMSACAHALVYECLSV